MAKKSSKPRTKTIPSLKGPVAKALRDARLLRGKVVESADLDALIRHLVTVQKAASEGCPRTFFRAFTLVSKPKASKASKKR